MSSYWCKECNEYTTDVSEHKEIGDTTEYIQLACNVCHNYVTECEHKNTYYEPIEGEAWIEVWCEDCGELLDDLVSKAEIFDEDRYKDR